MPLIKPYRKHFVNSFLYASILDFINVAYPFFFGLLVDEVFYNKNDEFLPIVIVIYLILLIGQLLFQSAQNFVGTYIYLRFMYDTKKVLFEKIFTLRAANLNSKNIGEFIVSINWDSEKLMDFLMWLTLQLTSNTLKLIIAFAAIAYSSVKIAVLAFILVPVSVILNEYISKVSKKNSERYRDSYGKFIGWIFEMISGIREIRLLAAEGVIKSKFSSNWNNLILLKKQTSIIELMSRRLQSANSLITDLIIYITAAVLISGSELTIGKFVSVLGYFGIAKSAMAFYLESKVRLQGSMVSIDRVLDLLDDQGEKDTTDKEDMDNSKSGVLFNSIQFGYEEGRSILKNVNLSINAGEKIAIVGRSGSGKSTILNLLLRFYDSYSGTIEINGKDIREYTIKSVRRNIGIIQQDSFLFSGTIRYNLELGNHNFTDKDIWHACDKACISDFIRSLPDGLDTVIGKYGMNLSGGQKQRLVIARLFIRNPKIIVLDEATSALDYETEKEVLGALKEICKGRTVIIIAHRLSSIMESDRVAVLNEGRIVSVDHHLKLLESCDYYRNLFGEQYKTQEVS